MIYKYPITRNGIEYEVVIEESTSTKYIWGVTLNKYEKIKILGLLNYNIKTKLFQFYYGLVEYKYYRFEDVEYLPELDFVYMTKDIFKKFEDNNKSKQQWDDKLSQATDIFNRWNGNIQ
jgi:hypothetical protein